MDIILTFFDLLAGSFLSLSVIALSSFAIILIFKTSITTNFAQGMVSAFGAFFTAYLITMHGWNMWLAIVVGILSGFLLGIFIDFGIIRRAKIVTPVGKQMITMGIVLVLLGLIPILFIKMQEVAIPRISEASIRLFDGKIILLWHDLIALISATLILSVLFILLKYSRWGLAVRATASNERVASMMGINTRVITAMSWSIAGGMGALAAIFLAASKPLLTSTDVGLMTPIQIQGFLAAVFGGFQTFHGPVVGSIIIVISRVFLNYLSSEWSPFIIYGLVLIVILIKPLGLFGKKVIKKV